MVNEPVFKQLRQIIPLYNSLTADKSKDQIDTIIKKLIVIVFGNISIKKISEFEALEFLNAIPDICSMTQLKSGDNNNSGDWWGDAYAHLCTCFGWTYDYIDDHMTLSRLSEITPYLRKNPPVHQLVASYMGYEDKTETDPMKNFFKSLKSAALNG